MGRLRSPLRRAARRHAMAARVAWGLSTRSVKAWRSSAAAAGSSAVRLQRLQQPRPAARLSSCAPPAGAAGAGTCGGRPPLQEAARGHQSRSEPRPPHASSPRGNGARPSACAAARPRHRSQQPPATRGCRTRCQHRCRRHAKRRLPSLGCRRARRTRLAPLTSAQPLARCRWHRGGLPLRPAPQPPAPGPRSGARRESSTCRSPQPSRSGPGRARCPQQRPAAYPCPTCRERAGVATGRPGCACCRASPRRAAPPSAAARSPSATARPAAPPPLPLLRLRLRLRSPWPRQKVRMGAEARRRPARWEWGAGGAPRAAAVAAARSLPSR